MGANISIRGFVQLSFEHRSPAEDIIRRYGDNRWTFPAKPFNWTLYLFYGADVPAEAVPRVRAEVAELAALPPVDYDDDPPTGLFHLTGEHGRTSTWFVRHGSVEDSPTTTDQRQ